MSVLIPIVIWAFSAPAAAPLIVVPPAKLDAVGDCIEPDGKADNLRNVRFLKARSITLPTRTGKLRVTLDGEKVRIENLRLGRAHGFYYMNIGDEVEPADDLDVELHFARLARQIVIYWKETYQHKIYRQGLFRIVDEHVESLCQGRGGLTTVD